MQVVIFTNGSTKNGTVRMGDFLVAIKNWSYLCTI